MASTATSAPAGTSSSDAGSDKRRLLLISNSTMFGEKYLEHCIEAIATFLGDIKTVAFLPFAALDWDEYEAAAKTKFAEVGITLTSLHQAKDPVEAANKAEAFFGGGGNTFRLLTTLYGKKLVEPIRSRILAGVPYIGTSAGSNLACPTIRTTNDMPIIYPPSFNALAAVSFQINPHYMDPDPTSKHNGETREKRIQEYFEVPENAKTVVVGLREGGMLLVEGGSVKLQGRTAVRIFRGAGAKPVEAPVGAVLDDLLTVASS